MYRMNGSAVLKTKCVRGYLGGAVVFGLLAAVATVTQMVLLGDVIGWVLLAGAGPAEVERSLALLLAVVVLRPLFVWLREVVALRGSEVARRRVRTRLVWASPARADTFALRDASFFYSILLEVGRAAVTQR